MHAVLDGEATAGEARALERAPCRRSGRAGAIRRAASLFDGSRACRRPSARRDWSPPSWRRSRGRVRPTRRPTFSAVACNWSKLPGMPARRRDDQHGPPGSRSGSFFRGESMSEQNSRFRASARCGSAAASPRLAAVSWFRSAWTSRRDGRTTAGTIVPAQRFARRSTWPTTSSGTPGRRAVACRRFPRAQYGDGSRSRRRDSCDGQRRGERGRQRHGAMRSTATRRDGGATTPARAVDSATRPCGRQRRQRRPCDSATADAVDSRCQRGGDSSTATRRQRRVGSAVDNAVSDGQSTVATARVSDGAARGRRASAAPATARAVSSAAQRRRERRGDGRRQRRRAVSDGQRAGDSSDSRKRRVRSDGVNNATATRQRGAAARAARRAQRRCPSCTRRPA